MKAIALPLAAAALFCACGGGSPPPTATQAHPTPTVPPFLTALIPRADDLPTRGSLEWAMALRQAKAEADKTKEPEAGVLRAYGRLLGLYRGCAGCERQAYKDLAAKVGRTHNLSLASDAQALMAREPVGFVEALGSGRREEARALAIALAGTMPYHEQRGKLYQLAGWLTALQNPRSVPPRRRDWQRKRLLRRGYDEMPATYTLQIPPDADAPLAAQLSFFVQSPDRVTPEQLAEYASTEKDAKLRATLLLTAAFRCEQSHQRVRAKELLCEARAAAGDDPRIVSAQRVQELWDASQWFDEEEWRQAAVAIIREYATYELSCSVCSQYLGKTRAVTEGSARSFIDLCRSQLDLCPQRVDMWHRLVRPPEVSDARAVDELLLASNPPPEIVPEILLALSLVMLDSDSSRAAELEDEAVQHPNVPWLDVALLRPMERARAAERRGDSRRALFWTIMGGSQTSGATPQTGPRQGFWDAYFSLRAGHDVDKQWERLLATVPATPDDPGMWLLQVDQLDRLICAASLVGKQAELRDRLRALALRHHEAIRVDLPADRRDRLRRVELLLKGYAADLDAGRVRCTS